MNARISEGNVVRTAKRILGLVGLAGLALIGVGPAWAQSQSLRAATTAARLPAASPETSPGAQSSGVANAAKPAGVQNSSAKASVANGQSEGIKVHGHWTIEVRNPDGRVVTHREFENALATLGSNVLAGLLSGNYVPGPWVISLFGNFDVDTPGTSGPCSAGPGQSCMIVSPNAANYVGCLTSPVKVSTGTQPACYATLLESLSVPAGSSFFSSFVLTGSAYADTSTMIVAVATQQAICPANALSASGAGGITLATASPSTCMTVAGTSSSGLTAVTSTNLTNPVPVTVGQTISATVQISFQ